ncbi:GNAT family N-acetyltransferase [Sphingomonas sp. RG327]|uniref:GNAT family N-acetyltransferase n=1 Tax=Sphingomonas anseongensis TaxID=2908207 RepID=A0ABT0RE97_9SPHN|nr:GNAT family N-acetyltransferase [Sphingomonas anseongensis]MCL6678607.1 GNAT family N-acetyltransferase [Sphingomonas anseongensis]
MSYEPLPEGQLAAVVTFLEMRKPPTDQVPASSLSFRRIHNPDPGEYRQLFRRIGRHWLWFSRLTMTDAELAAIIQDEAVELYVVIDELGTDIGMLELDFREANECEIAFIGLLPELAGRGHGRWLLAETLQLAWRDGIRRVHVHTCTLDHPAALPAYRTAGFRPCRFAVERFRDPRLLGILPPDSAPQVPLLGTPMSMESRPAS